MVETKFNIATHQENGQSVTTMTAVPPINPKEALRIGNDLEMHTGDGVDYTFDSSGTELTIRVDDDHTHRENPMPALIGAAVATVLVMRNRG